MIVFVGAALPAEGKLVVGRRAGDHARAHQLADLDRREAGAAGGAEHRERLAGFELGAVLQRVQRRAVDHRDAGGAVEVERVGDLHHALRGDRDLLARRAEAAIAEHAVAGAKPVTPAPTLSTTPANSEAGENGNGGLNWYLPAMISVSKKLSAADLTATTTSPAARHRIGQVVEFEIVRAAEARAENGFHGAKPG